MRMRLQLSMALLGKLLSTGFPNGRSKRESIEFRAPSAIRCVKLTMPPQLAGSQSKALSTPLLATNGQNFGSFHFAAMRTAESPFVLL